MIWFEKSYIKTRLENKVMKTNGRDCKQMGETGVLEQ